MREQTVVQFEYLHSPRNRWFEHRIYPSPDGVTVFLADISDRKRIEAERRQAEAEIQQLNQQLRNRVNELQTLFDLLPVGVAIAQDPDCRMIRANPHLSELLRVPIDVNASHSAPPEERPLYRLCRDGEELPVENLPMQYVAIHNTEVKDEVLDLVHPDGTVVKLLSYCSPLLDEQGNVRGALGAFVDITERIQNEAALRESEQRLKIALQTGKLGSWQLHLTTGVLESSDRCKANFGLAPEENLSYQRLFELIHPDDRPYVRETVERAIAQRIDYDAEYRTIWLDGSVHWIIARGRAIYAADGTPTRMIGVTLDITERKQVEEALQESEQQLRLASESAKLGLWHWNVERDILTWTDRCKALFGLPADIEMSYQVFLDALHPDDRQRVQDMLPLLEEGQLERHEEAVRFIGTVLNITAQKQAEAEREQLLAREQAAREAAEAANSIKDEFLAIVSHELRSPLNPILGWSKLLRTRQLDKQKTDRALEVIERNAQIQAQLINDLLDVSRILRGKLSLDNRPVDLASTIQAAMETVRLAAEAKSIQIHTQFEPDVGQVLGDAGRLQQVIWNLLSNAVKFTSEGGRVDIRLSSITSPSSWGKATQPRTNNQQQMTSYAQIAVTDTGKGIPPDFLPYVFDRFRQESSATTRRFGGLGLGLAIIRYLVELHGGTVQADSLGEGQGATFTVRLPLIPHQPTMNQETQPSESSLDLQGIRILVVDDEDNTREFLAFLLELHEANAIATATADEAIATLTQFKPDILLSDIGMPDVDGYMLMQQIRALSPEEGGTIPAIALTAYAGEINYQQAMAAGFQRHLAKPIEPDTLIQAISKALNMGLD
jgi:PAS domain S-box-containing protein